MRETHKYRYIQKMGLKKIRQLQRQKNEQTDKDIDTDSTWTGKQTDGQITPPPTCPIH